MAHLRSRSLGTEECQLIKDQTKSHKPVQWMTSLVGACGGAAAAAAAACACGGLGGPAQGAGAGGATAAAAAAALRLRQGRRCRDPGVEYPNTVVLAVLVP